MNFLNRIDKDITLLLDNLPVGIIRFNDKHRCIYANRFVINLLGLDISRQDENISEIYLNAIHKDDKKLKLAFPAVVCACMALTLTKKRAIKNPSFCKK